MSTPYLLAKFIPKEHEKYDNCGTWDGQQIGIDPKPISNDRHFMMFRISEEWKRYQKDRLRPYPIFKYVDGCDLQIKPTFKR